MNHNTYLYVNMQSPMVIEFKIAIPSEYHIFRIKK